MPKSYIRGRYANAAVDLMDHLHGLGVIATVGYAVTNPKGRMLYAYVRAGDLSKVPAEFDGMKVVAERETFANSK